MHKNELTGIINVPMYLKLKIKETEHYYVKFNHVIHSSTNLMIKVYNKLDT